MYKVYGNNKAKGWEILKETKSLAEARKIVSKMEGWHYYSYIIKESTQRGDTIIECEQLYEDFER